MAAPALAASIADCAICAGVTGTAGLRPGVSAEPVTAHETMTLRCMPLSQDADRALQRSLARGRCRAQSFAWAGMDQSQRVRFMPAVGSSTGKSEPLALGLPREPRFGRPAACLALCTALSLLAPVLGTDPI